MTVKLMSHTGVIAVVKTDRDLCRGGKRPGGAQSTRVNFERVLPKQFAQLTRSVVVQVDKTGSRAGIGATDTDAINKGISVIVLISG
jgi:hypothetical protein